MNEKQKKSNNDLQKKDVYTIVLEELRSQFKVFGESLDGFRKETRERLDKLEKNQEVTLEYLYRIDDRLNEIEKDLKEIKAKLKTIDENKVDKIELDSLKEKIKEIEKKLKKAVEWRRNQQKLTGA